MKFEATECGFTKGGLRVRALTDTAGSQVVVTNDESPDGTHLLSQPLINHKAAITLGMGVAEQGINIYDKWGSPLGMFEIACLAVEASR